MKYYLFIWITGCVGFNCPIPEFEEQEYASQERCQEGLEVAMKVAKMTNKKYAGVCLPEDMRNRIMEERGSQG